MLTLTQAARTRIWGATALFLSGVCVASAAEALPKPGAARAAAVAATPSSKPARTGFWQSARDGWFWYVDPPAAEDPEDEQDALRSQAESAPSTQDVDLAAHKAFQQRLERATNAAVINPTDANVAEFLEAFAEMRRKASVFTDAAQVMAARMPWVDETAQGTRPTNPVAVRVFDQVQMETKDDLMRSLAQTHGIYFFFRGDCAYCHAQAPMLKQLAMKYGFTVFPISMDGGSLSFYSNAVRDNGMAAQVMEQLRIPQQHFQVPFTVLANPRTRELVPVGFGPMSADEMVERIAMVLKVQQVTVRPAQPALDVNQNLRAALGGSASFSTKGEIQ